MLAMIGLVGGPLLLLLLIFFFFLPLGLALLAFWIWMLIDAIQNKGLTDNERIVWVLVVVLLHWLGALIYFLVGHPKRKTPRPPA